MAKPIFRPSDSDHKQVEQMRELVEHAPEVLKQSSPDTFVGRKTREPFSTEHESRTWSPIDRFSDIPPDCDLRLAVIEKEQVHELAFPCRYRDSLWVNSATGKLVEVCPTHYQPWAAVSRRSD